MAHYICRNATHIVWLPRKKSLFFLRKWTIFSLASTSKKMLIRKNFDLYSEPWIAGTWIRSSKTFSSDHPLAPSSIGRLCCGCYCFPLCLATEVSGQSLTYFPLSWADLGCFTIATSGSNCWCVSCSIRALWTARLKQYLASYCLPRITTPLLEKGTWAFDGKEMPLPSSLLAKFYPILHCMGSLYS